MADSAGLIETDAVVIGAGPVGLFQVFELGLLEIRAHVVDSLPQAGGQCIELYPDKPIYDIPALPASSGRELTGQLLRQVAPFAPQFHFGQTVTALQRNADGRFLLDTSRGLRFGCKVVFIAAGVGAFQPRRLKVEGLEAFEGTQVHHQLADPASLAGRDVVIVGGGDLALGWAVPLAEPGPHCARSVTLVHRRDSFQAAPELIAQVQSLRHRSALRFVAGQVTGHDTATDAGGTRLAALTITGSDDTASRLPLDVLLVGSGLSPRLGPIANWGLALERKQLVVDTEKFETSEPGIFAVGDINSYPGKRKLILCGFHEATLAAFGAAPRVHPDRPVQLQYTTTSTRLHHLLGVDGPPPG